MGNFQFFTCFVHLGFFLNFIRISRYQRFAVKYHWNNRNLWIFFDFAHSFAKVKSQNINICCEDPLQCDGFQKLVFISTYQSQMWWSFLSQWKWKLFKIGTSPIVHPICAYTPKKSRTRSKYKVEIENESFWIKWI